MLRLQRALRLPMRADAPRLRLRRQHVRPVRRNIAIAVAERIHAVCAGRIRFPAIPDIRERGCMPDLMPITRDSIACIRMPETAVAIIPATGIDLRAQTIEDRKERSGAYVPLPFYRESGTKCEIGLKSADLRQLSPPRSDFRIAYRYHGKYLRSKDKKFIVLEGGRGAGKRARMK